MSMLQGSVLRGRWSCPVRDSEEPGFWQRLMVKGPGCSQCPAVPSQCVLAFLCAITERKGTVGLGQVQSKPHPSQLPQKNFHSCLLPSALALRLLWDRPPHSWRTCSQPIPPFATWILSLYCMSSFIQDVYAEIRSAMAQTAF